MADSRYRLPAERARAPVGGDGWAAAGDGVPRTRWYAVVSSRLGRPVEKRRRWFELLRRVIERTIADDAALTIVEGTAAEPWVSRAAQLYGAATVRICVDDPAERDRALVQLADHVYALHVRRGGRIEELLAERIRDDPASVRVAIGSDPRDAGANLLAAGAVGWWLAGDSAGDGPGDQRFPDRDVVSDGYRSSLPTSEPRFSAATSPSPGDGESPLGTGAWLIHCTRGRSGRWPWQSEQQWRDEVLLGGDEGGYLGPAEVLQRIVRDRVLRGCALVTSAGPVVCFSAVPLAELLSRRIFRSHLGRWDYEPYGIAIRRDVVQRLGGMPVVYAESWDSSGLTDDQRWRFQACGTTFDWRREEEWRVPGSVDLRRIAADEALLFVGDRLTGLRLAAISPWPVSLVENGSPSL